MENVSPIITAKNLNLWYGDFKALKDISLDMGEREITALIGPLRLRQVHLPEDPEPDERPCARDPHRG